MHLEDSFVCFHGSAISHISRYVIYKLTVDFQSVAHSDPRTSTRATDPLGVRVVFSRSSGHVSQCQGRRSLVDGCSCVHLVAADEVAAPGLGARGELSSAKLPFCHEEILACCGINITSD